MVDFVLGISGKKITLVDNRIYIKIDQANNLITFGNENEPRLVVIITVNFGFEITTMFHRILLTQMLQ